jgi:hypothetical protein
MEIQQQHGKEARTMATATTTITTITAQLIAAFESTWQAIQQRHPEVPRVVVTLGSGTLGVKPGQARLGHFAADRWQHGESERLAELFISGEGLRDGAAGVLGTLLHEAAHGLAHVRGVKDTSRQGRYHNRRFKALGEELGLVLAEDSRIGWSITAVPQTTTDEYRAELEQLTNALVAYRHAEVTVSAGGKKNTNLAVATCACPRKIRVAPSTLAEAPILCGACETEFVAETDED